MEIRSNVELPKIVRSGRPKGSGKNIRLLRSLRPEETVWDVPSKRMRSIYVSASDIGIKLMVRKIPGSKKYAFKIIAKDQDN